MQIEEIVRSCVHESVAQVAVQCIGRTFCAAVEDAAANYGMTLGAFAALSVELQRAQGESRLVGLGLLGAEVPLWL